MAIFQKSIPVSVDVLEEKKKTLAEYMDEFDCAVSVVTGTIDNLNQLGEDIDKTIQEIEDYQRNLEETKTGLEEARQKNSRVIKNFKALLAED